jgi:hypothetical protein
MHRPDLRAICQNIETVREEIDGLINLENALKKEVGRTHECYYKDLHTGIRLRVPASTDILIVSVERELEDSTRKLKKLVKQFSEASLVE